MLESYIEAASVSLTLFGRSSKILLGQSRMVARSGNFTISISEDSLLDVIDRFAPQPSAPVLQTAGLFSLWTDASSISFKNAAIRAGSGIDINLADELPSFKSEETDFITAIGTVAIYGNYRDTKIEISKGVLSGPGGVRVALTGRNSGLVLKDAEVNGGNGPVSILAGSYSSTAEVSQSSIQTNASVELLAGSFGSKITSDNNTIRGNSGVTVNAASRSSAASAKNNIVTSLAFFTVSAGFLSSCDTDGNIVNAPSQSLCR